MEGQIQAAHEAGHEIQATSQEAGFHAKPKQRKARTKVVFVKAKKKCAVARAKVRKGTGKITINDKNINLIQPKQLLEFVKEPLMLAESEGKDLDIDVQVNGSGFMSQATAARAVIAKGIIAFSGNERLKKKMLAYDRMLLVDDFRRVEPKKPLGTKARKKKQKSKR